MHRQDEPKTAMMGGVMTGLKGIVFGVANNRSIAWGIAKAIHDAGGALAFTYQGEALEKRVRPLAAELGATVLGHCDVTDGATIDAAFEEAKKLWGKIDFVVHCVAFADKDELTGRYVDTTEGNFNKSLAISCYSFTAIAQRAEKMMPEGGSLLTLTYYGAEKWMPHYNVMGVAKAALEAGVRYLAADYGPSGVRVNAISAGPIRTLAGAGIARRGQREQQAGKAEAQIRQRRMALAERAHGGAMGFRKALEPAFQLLRANARFRPDARAPVVVRQRHEYTPSRPEAKAVRRL